MNTVNMSAPVGGDSKKLEVAKIPVGFQLCTLYGMSDLLTQDGGNYGPKHKLGLMFEFPLQKRVFYEGGDMMPSASYMEYTFSMHEKAGLRDFVHGMLGRKLSNDEAEKFDLSSLLGKSFVATIVHSADGKYANIDTLTPLAEDNKKLFDIVDVNAVEKCNKMFFFHSSQGFESDNFKTLPNFIRDKIKSSKEGKSHLASGGKFSEPDSNDNSGTQAPQKRKLIMLVNDHTYEQYKVNWTDEQLVAHGKAKWEEAVAPPTPVDNSPAPPLPSPVSAPTASPVPGVPETPVEAPVPVFKMNDGSDPAAWFAKNWTEDLLIQHGHASFQ